MAAVSYWHVSLIAALLSEGYAASKPPEVFVDGTRRNVNWTNNGKRKYQGVFIPTLDLHHHQQLQLRLHVMKRKRFLGRLEPADEDVLIEVANINQGSNAERGPGNYQYQILTKSKAKHKVILDFTSDAASSMPSARPDTPQQSQGRDLQPTTEEIIRICPRFRILVIGNTGVGKSSLINHSFGVEDAMVSSHTPGLADIEKEISSKKNPYFVLHDSQGFEPGDVTHLQTVYDFIRRRNEERDLKDMLHAIWLCFAIPTAGASFLEAGVEDFLRSKTEGRFGNLPVIAVFTKFDGVVAEKNSEMDESRCRGLSDEEIERLAKGDAEKAVQDLCIYPLEDLTGKTIPHIAVSTWEGYENTISQLIELTHAYVTKDVSVVTAIAQQANPNVNIDAIIEVGRRKYWSSLVSSTNFPGKRIEKCLDVIHKDIVVVWRFDDPHRYLFSPEFKALMSNLVAKVDDRPPRNPNATFTTGLGLVGTVAGIVSALSGPAAPIVIPVATAVVMATWVYEVYQQSTINIQRFMAYIVDLTLILQNLYWLAGRSPVSRRMIKLAFRSYDESATKVHYKINTHITDGVAGRSQDKVLEKIIELINGNRFKHEEMFALKAKLEEQLAGGPGEDEAW